MIPRKRFVQVVREATTTYGKAPVGTGKAKPTRKVSRCFATWAVLFRVLHLELYIHSGCVGLLSALLQPLVLRAWMACFALLRNFFETTEFPRRL